MSNNILIYKTNINTIEQLKTIDSILSSKKEIKKWNIDIDDCDKVLRIESTSVEIETTIAQLKTNNVYCEELV